MITAKQIRAARVLTRLTQEQLSQEAKVPLRTLMNIETGRIAPSPVFGAALKVVLEKEGVEFLPGDKVKLRQAHISDDPFSYF